MYVWYVGGCIHVCTYKNKTLLAVALIENEGISPLSGCCPLYNPLTTNDARIRLNVYFCCGCKGRGMWILKWETDFSPPSIRNWHFFSYPPKSSWGCYVIVVTNINMSTQSGTRLHCSQVFSAKFLQLLDVLTQIPFFPSAPPQLTRVSREVG